MSGMIHLLYKRKTLTPEEEQEICLKCQFCCRWIGYHVSLKANPAEYYSFVNTWGIPTSLRGETVHFWVPFPCQHIREGTGCQIYDERPALCRAHKGGDSDPSIIPYCGWYEPVSDKEKFESLRSIEWGK